MNVSRRKTLLVTGASLGLAGCIDDLPGSPDQTPDNDTSDNNGNDNGSSDGAVETDVFQLGAATSKPLWAKVEDTTGFVTLITDDRYDRPWMVENPEEVNGLESWLHDETDFESSNIVYVETAAPNTCYGKFEVSDLTVEDGAIVGTAEAVDTSGEDEACGQAETHPAAFVRVTGDDLPDEASFTVVDGWGEASEVTSDGPYVAPANLPGFVQPDGEPEPIEPLSCDDEDFQRLEGPAGDEAQLGEVHDDEDLSFAMRVHDSQTVAAGDDEGSGPRVGRGHEVRVTLWNVSTDVQHTAVRHKWNLQVLTEDGWQDVRGTRGGERLGYDDLAIAHRPGEGFEWAFEMTEDGVLEGHSNEDRLEVCPDLQPGRYRFVYRSITNGEPIAVEFDYEG